jgi:hypothetical protein
MDKDGVISFLHRSYSAVDGLWFVKVEEQYGFEAALELDRRVWEVLPKIQARMLKKTLGLENGLQGLRHSLIERLNLDGFTFKSKEPAEDKSFCITVTKCPWHELMVKSGRAHLSGRIGDVICPADYSAWAHEFGDIGFGLGAKICQGEPECRMVFTRNAEAAGPAPGETV